MDLKRFFIKQIVGYSEEEVNKLSNIEINLMVVFFKLLGYKPQDLLN